MNFIVGKKLNMSQIFLESGEVIPVTVLKTPPMVVTHVKEASGKDKYSAVQVGVSKSVSGSKKVSKAVSGHLKGLSGIAKLAEFRVKDTADYARGKKIDVSTFQIGEFVDVIGTMKGRGFAGAMK